MGLISLAYVDVHPTVLISVIISIRLGISISLLGYGITSSSNSTVVPGKQKRSHRPCRIGKDNAALSGQGFVFNRNRDRQSHVF